QCAPVVLVGAKAAAEHHARTARVARLVRLRGLEVPRPVERGLERVERVRPKVQRAALEGGDAPQLVQRERRRGADPTAELPMDLLRDSYIYGSRRAVLEIVGDQVVNHENR